MVKIEEVNKQFTDLELNDLKKWIIENNLISTKYKYLISGMDKVQLFSFIYNQDFQEKQFEGIATIISSCVAKDVKRLTKYITEVKLGGINIIRIVMDTLKNIEFYNNEKNKKFYFELLKFKIQYEKKLKIKLFKIGQKRIIDKLDTIWFFIEVMK
jgi:hypothetical protein